MDDDLDALLDSALEVMDQQDREHQEELKNREEEAAQLMREQTEATQSGMGSEEEQSLITAVTSLLDVLRKGPEAFDEAPETEMSRIQEMLTKTLGGMREGATDEELRNIEQCQELLKKAGEVDGRAQGDGTVDDAASGVEDLQAMMKALQELSGKDSANDGSASGASVSRSGGGGEDTAASVQAACAEMLKMASSPSASNAASAPTDEAPEAPGMDEKTLRMLFEILQPKAVIASFQAMTDAFPAWFEQNDKNLSEEDRVRFRAQHATMQEVLHVVDKGPLEDALKEGATEEQKERLLEFSTKLEKLQTLGMPPTTLNDIIAAQREATAPATDL